MPIGDQRPLGDDAIWNAIRDLQQSFQQLFAQSSGAKNIATAVQTGLGTLASGGTTWAGPVASPSTVTAAGSVSAPQGTFSSGLSSAGAYGTDVSLLAGARQQVWQHNSGVYGFAPSTQDAKTNLGPIPFTADDVRAVSPHVFQYKGQLAIRVDPDNPYYDPDYEVPWETGLMAEDLIAHGMGCFVFWETDGSPKGINYDLFAAVATLVLAADVDARLRSLGV